MDFAKPRRAVVQRHDDMGVQLQPMPQNPPDREQAPETLQMLKTPSPLNAGASWAASAAHVGFPVAGPRLHGTDLHLETPARGARSPWGASALPGVGHTRHP